jgi:hypothetical protein
LYNNVDFGLD